MSPLVPSSYFRPLVRPVIALLLGPFNLLFKFVVVDYRAVCSVGHAAAVYLRTYRPEQSTTESLYPIADYCMRMDMLDSLLWLENNDPRIPWSEDIF